MNIKRKLLSLTLAALLLAVLSPAALATGASTASSELSQGGGVAARLEHIQHESGYTVGSPEYNCYLFAKRVFYKLFEYDDNPNINYHGDYNSADYTTQLVGRLYTPMKCSIDGCGGKDPVSAEAKSYTIGAVTANNVGLLLERAMPGDVLQGHSGNNVHTMIIVSVIRNGAGSVTGVDVYHGNYNSAVSRNTFTIEHLAETYDHALSVYHAANYTMMDIGTAVYFEGCGGSPTYKSTFVNGGDEIGELPDASRPGYDFTGWYTAESGGSAADPATVPTTFELTYYAHWSAKEYAVSFDAAGGDLAPEPISVRFGSSYGRLPDAGSKPGYAFEGWFTSPEGGTRIDSDTMLTLSYDHALYAHWTPERYEVTFVLNGGSCDVSGTTVTYGEPYGPLPVPAREGYIFSGWSTDERGVNRRTSATPAVKASDHNLYAQWTQGISGAPQNLAIASAGGSVELSWTALDGASGYQIYRRAAGEEFFSRLTSTDGADAVTAADNDRAAGATYEYRARAFRTLETGTVYGPWSDSVAG